MFSYTEITTKTENVKKIIDYNNADNFHLDVKAKLLFLEMYLNNALDSRLVYGIRVIRNNEDKSKYNFKDIDGKYQLILYWTKIEDEFDDMYKFPIGLNAEEVTPIIIKLFADKNIYPKYPDIDGECSKGFYLTTGKYWNYIEDYGHSAAVLIMPCWMYHHI